MVVWKAIFLQSVFRDGNGLVSLVSKRQLTGVRHPTVGVPGIIAGVPGITGVVVPSDKYLGCSGVGGQPA
eukprot:3844852-Amphidinium_carterae.2